MDFEELNNRMKIVEGNKCSRYNYFNFRIGAIIAA